MRKLLVVIAVLALIGLLYGCGGSSDHPEPEAVQAPATKNNERTYHPTVMNVKAYWFHYAGYPPAQETIALHGGEWVPQSNIAGFSTTDRGVRLAHGSHTDVYRIRVRYAKHERRYPWNGKGLLPLAKTVTSIYGKQQVLPLKEIRAYLYNRPIGEGVPLRRECLACG